MPPEPPITAIRQAVCRLASAAAGTPVAIAELEVRYPGPGSDVVAIRLRGQQAVLCYVRQGTLRRIAANLARESN